MSAGFGTQYRTLRYALYFDTISNRVQADRQSGGPGNGRDVIAIEILHGKL